MEDQTTKTLLEKIEALEARIEELELARAGSDPRIRSDALRVGYGNDLHRFTEGSSLKLGGVTIPIADAILGGAGLGDIGELFPDTSEENRDRDSAEILAICAEEVARAGWRVVNLDCVVCAQRPKLGPLKKAMRDRIAGILDLPPERVNVKAKTGEHVGPVGRMEAIETFAVALLAPISDNVEDPDHD